MEEEKIKLKLSIADRVYPLIVNASQKELILNVVDSISKILKELEKNYSVKDKQDVLAMCVLQLATKLEQLDDNDDIDKVKVESKIDDILNSLSF